MNELITLCGDDCLKCPRYSAKTDKELAHLAELWYKIGWRGSVLSAEEMRCSGCTPVKKCTYGLVECTAGHKVSKCSECPEFPCGKIDELLERSHRYEEKCAEVCTSEEFETLKAAFFNNEINLRK